MNLEKAAQNVFYSRAIFNPGSVRVADILIDPTSDSEAFLYVSHHILKTDCIAISLSRLKIRYEHGGISAGDDNWEEIFSARPCIPPKETGNFFAGIQVGGRLLKPTENTILLALGDQEYDGVNHPEKAPMDDKYDLGKLLEIDLESKDVRIYASGLRNPQGLALAADGTIWETEHGPKGGDEVNLLLRGKNYGWPEVTHGVLYGFPTRPWPSNPEQGRHTGYEMPKFAFLPSIGISNVIETNSTEFPAWKGDLLVASLKANTVFRLRRFKNEVIYSEPILSLGRRIRDTAELSDGRVAMLTDYAEIILLRRKISFEKHPVEKPSVSVVGYDGVRAVVSAHKRAINSQSSNSASSTNRKEWAKDLFNARCSNCHNLHPENNVGPHLAGVAGRKIGSVEGFFYSDALSSPNEVWTEDKLIEFLSNPEKNFEGTTMPHIELAKEHYEPIVKYLSQFD